MKNLFSLILFLTISINSYSKSDSVQFSRWYIKPAIGLNTPISNLLKGELSDHLISYDDHSFYLQLISGNLFFTKNWGVEFTYQLNAATSKSNSRSDFATGINDFASGNYFVNPDGTEYTGIASTNFDKVLIGAVYRIEKQRFLILPKLLFGLISYSAETENIVLKQRNSNSIYKLSYTPNESAGGEFILSPAITLGYRLNKFILLNCDFQYSIFNSSLVYEHAFRNTFTNDTRITTIDYGGMKQSFSVGVGLIVEIKYFNP